MTPIASVATPHGTNLQTPKQTDGPCQKRFTVALGETPPAAPSPSLPVGPLSAAKAPEENAAAKLVARLLDDEKVVDRGLAQALRGGAMSPQELLALQVKVVRYSQELEVASRIVEKLSGAVKQTMQTQV